MHISTHQPVFLPWPGFFHKARHSDALVLLDEVQFPQGRSWMSRNRVKSDQGELWLKVPVLKKGLGLQRIGQVRICEEEDWRARHLRGIRLAYAHAPYLRDYLPVLESAYRCGHERLLDLNLELIRFLLDALNLKTRLILQSELGIAGAKTRLLTDICRALGAGTYLALPFAAKHLEAVEFHRQGIHLEFLSFTPPIYPQLWGEFRYNLSCLDLLLTCGPRSLEILGQPA